MTNQNPPNPSNEKLAEILRGLTTNQIRFVIARLDTATDKEAAMVIGLKPSSVASWENKKAVDEAVGLMRYDGMVTALELRRRYLAKAMAVKAAGLESDNEKIRQDVATEMIEWELGKATQPTDNKHSGQVTLIWDLPIPPSA